MSPTPIAVRVFDAIKNQLSERLRDPLHPGRPGARAIKRQLRELFDLLNENSPASRLQASAHLIRLESFVGDWDAVAVAMPEYVPELRKRFRRDEVAGGYAGTRSELALAAFLVEGWLRPRRGPKEGADFLVEHAAGSVVIESTSAHSITGREDNFAKIERAIRAKAAEPYCGGGAILHVDYTAIVRDGGEAMRSDFIERFAAVVADTQWGAVLISALFVTPERSEYRRPIIRSDGQDPSGAVQAMLDALLPGEPRYLGPVWIPPMS